MKYKTALSLLLLSIAIIAGGCTTKPVQTKHHMTKGMMFQSVPKGKATILQKGPHAYSCAICGMNLPMFYKTNHTAKTPKGIKQYCSLHCLVYDNEFNKTDLYNVKVVDTNSLRFIDAMKAWYVVGSNKPATMSRISKYAFKSEKEAKAFAKKYGGKVMHFYDAYKIATQDFTKKQ